MEDVEFQKLIHYYQKGVETRNKEIVEEFLYDSNIKDINGFYFFSGNDYFHTTIFMASCTVPNNDDIIKLLLDDIRIDPNIYDKSTYNTPFASACSNQSEETIIYCLENIRMDPNMCGYHQQTALHKLCTNGMNHKTNIMTILLEDPRMDVNRQDYIGNTAFHYACAVCSDKVINLFLESDRVDPNIFNNNGKTAFGTVCINNRINIMRLLFDNSKIDTKNCSKDGTTSMQLFFHSSDRYTDFKYMLESCLE